MEDTVAKMIGLLFMSRTAAHMAHLVTPSYSKHKALQKFYENIIDLADTLAESGQGKFGKLNVPFMDLKGDPKDPIGMMETHLLMVENLGKKCDDRHMAAVVDEIIGEYRAVLYKMKELD